MNKSEERPVTKALGETPDAYYYLGRFVEDCRRIREQHYENRKEMVNRLEQLVSEYFGSMEDDGFLQKDINLYYNGILNDLKRDYPRFTRRRILLFSYTAARLPPDLICRCTGIENAGAVSSMKSKMKVAIACHACARRDEYLDLLSR